VARSCPVPCPIHHSDPCSQPGRYQCRYDTTTLLRRQTCFRRRALARRHIAADACAGYLTRPPGFHVLKLQKSGIMLCNRQSIWSQSPHDDRHPQILCRSWPPGTTTPQAMDQAKHWQPDIAFLQDCCYNLSVARDSVTSQFQDSGRTDRRERGGYPRQSLGEIGNEKGHLWAPTSSEDCCKAFQHFSA
jgi:hypothetical protein